MSIPNYLETLDYDQLICARKLADSLIKKKDGESKKRLWCVSDDCVNLAFFIESEHKEAAKKMSSEITSYASRFPGRPIKMSMTLIYVRDSEHKEYLDL